jgi:hypothetical protein
LDVGHKKASVLLAKELEKAGITEGGQAITPEAIMSWHKADSGHSAKPLQGLSEHYEKIEREFLERGGWPGTQEKAHQVMRHLIGSLRPGFGGLRKTPT